MQVFELGKNLKMESDRLDNKMRNKNSSGDEIANVNLFTTISHMSFKISKKRTYFV